MAITVDVEWGHPDSEVAITVDVEWAHPEVMADTVRLLEERGLRATFFCTHEGIELPGHERALHPNFRRRHNSLVDGRGDSLLSLDAEFYRFVVQASKTFCPEAVGVRAHSLFFDSDLLAIYRDAGIEYDSSCYLPLTPAAPIRRGCGILELPIYYLDHWDLSEQATGFALSGVQLQKPGIKVFDFHPNLVFINAATNAQYLDSKPYYHDPDRLLRLRHPGRGVRTLFLDLLDSVAARGWETPTLAEINRRHRTFEGCETACD
jgi:hypothetical protein